MKNKKQTKKKKGFTLIELIAVIAILAILGAILVPRIAGYQQKARKSNLQSSAKTIVHAIQNYNADKSGTNADPNFPVIQDTDTVSDVIPKYVNTENNEIVVKTTDSSYVALSNLTVADLVGVANGNFSLQSGGALDTATIVKGKIGD